MLNSHKLIANLTWVISRKDIENQFTIWCALTHWGRVTHICVGKLTIIGSDNGLSPGRRQAIIRTNAGILLIGTLGTNSSKILSEIRTFSFKKMHLKMSSGRWRPFCLGLNVLRDTLPLLNAIHMLFEDYLLLPFPFVLNGSVAHRSRSQDIDPFKFQVSYNNKPLQDTCPITTSVLGHLIRTHVPLIFLYWDKKSYQLSEKCATLKWYLHPALIV